MTLVKLNRKPFGLNNFVDELFNDLPAFLNNDFNNAESKGLIPVNVKETENSYKLEVIAPGFEKTDFKIGVEDNLLTISAEKKEETKVEKDPGMHRDKQIRREYSFKSFKRSFTLDEKIDATKIEANYVNGVLGLNLPKKEVVKPASTEITIK